jgi:sirohydrochlorin cobaltochelatase
MTSRPGDEEFKKCALVLAGHGSTVNPDSSSPTLAHARAIREAGIFAEVAVCFWKEEPGFHEVLRMIESPVVYVVPNFISEGYFTRTVIPREIGLDGRHTRREGREFFYCEPAGSHSAMTDLLIRQASAAAPGVDPRTTSLIIVGHGTGLDANSAEAAKWQAAKIAETGRYAEVFATYMEEDPLISDWDTLATQPNVVVVPFFISDGLHSYQDIPVLLGIRKDIGPAASRSEVFRENPHQLRGRNLFYSGAIGSDPAFAEVILDQVRASRAAVNTACTAAECRGYNA